MPDRDIRFSLVLATVGRSEELANFLLHLETQSYRHFELIVVDQNLDDRLVPILAEYLTKFSIQHFRSARGVSRARNVGIKVASGNVIAFPDDDCWYPPHLLERVAGVLDGHREWDAVTGRLIDKSFSRFDTVSGPIDKYNVFLRSSEQTIFLRRSLVERVGLFDEGLGLGSTTGIAAAEGADYLIRAMAMEFRLCFNADLQIFHRDPPGIYDANFNKKARGYNWAFGFVLRRYDYPVWYVARTWIRAFGGMCVAAVSFNQSKMRYHANVLVGRMLGYWQYR